MLQRNWLQRKFFLHFPKEVISKYMVFLDSLLSKGIDFNEHLLYYFFKEIDFQTTCFLYFPTELISTHIIFLYRPQEVILKAHPLSTCSKGIDFNVHFLSRFFMFPQKAHLLYYVFRGNWCSLFSTCSKGFSFQHTSSLYMFQTNWFWKHVFYNYWLFSEEVISTHIFFLHVTKGIDFNARLLSTIFKWIAFNKHVLSIYSR